MDDLGAAGAREPNLRAIPPAVQLAAPLVLRDEGHQGVEHLWHGGGEIITGLTLRLACAGLAKRDV
jgi:hypothetical protein